LLLLQHPYCFDSSFVLSVLLTRQLEFAFSHPLLVVGLDSAASCSQLMGEIHMHCVGLRTGLCRRLPLVCYAVNTLTCNLCRSGVLRRLALHPSVGFASSPCQLLGLRRLRGGWEVCCRPSALWNFCGASVMGCSPVLVPQCMRRVCGVGGQSDTLCTAAFALGQHIWLADAAFAPDRGCRGC
jgi:hypothetical protein